MKNGILLLLSVISSFTCLAQSGVYKRVDQDGRTVYSNFQTGEAIEIQLPELTVLPAATRPMISAAKRGVVKQDKQPETDNMNIDPVIDEPTTQMGEHDLVQQLIEDMALYEDNIEALEIELYNLGGGY